MATFDSIINKKKKDWNCSTLMDAANAERGPKIPFSSLMLNYATYGGIPRRRLIHFYGNYGSGKTSTCIDLCKRAYDIFEQEFQEQVYKLQERSVTDKSAAGELEELKDRGIKKVLYLDLEHTFDSVWAKSLGINPEHIKVMQPPNVIAEDILQTLLDLIVTGEVGLIVIDSIPSLTTAAELKKNLDEKTVASKAGLLTTFVTKVIPLLDRYDCTIIMVNQNRDNLVNPYVTNTPGGRAIKFYSSLMLEFSIGEPVDFLGNVLPQKAENPAGYKINVKVTKQKTAPFDRKNASYYLMATSGIRTDMDLAQLAVTKYNIIKKSGAWFTVSDPYTGEIYDDPNTGKTLKLQGMAKVYDYINENRDYYQKLEKFILEDLSGTDHTDVAEDFEEEYSLTSLIPTGKPVGLYDNPE